MATVKQDIRIEKGSYGTTYRVFKVEDGFDFVNRDVDKKRAILNMGPSWDVVRVKGDIILLKNPKIHGTFFILDGQHRIYRLSEDPTVEDHERAMTATIHDTVADFPAVHTTCGSQSPVHRYFYALNTKIPKSVLTAKDSGKIASKAGECRWIQAFRKASLINKDGKGLPKGVDESSIAALQVRIDACLDRKAMAQGPGDRSFRDAMLYTKDDAKIERMASFLKWWIPIGTELEKDKSVPKVGWFALHHVMPIMYVIWDENQDANGRLNPGLVASELIPRLRKNAGAIQATKDLSGKKTIWCHLPPVYTGIARAVNDGRRRVKGLPSPNMLTFFGKYYMDKD